MPTRPLWLDASVRYEATMGSNAYGTNSAASDTDIYGWCIPPAEEVFPHRRGVLQGFDSASRGFEQFEQHHIIDAAGREFDIVIFSLVKYAFLLGANNPNIIDSLFVPDDCVVTCSPAAALFRDRRRSMLHRGYFHTAFGFAHAQLKKMRVDREGLGPRRTEAKALGYDTKFAAHALRVSLQALQVLKHGDLDLRANVELLNAVRQGEMFADEVERRVCEMEAEARILYDQSSLPWGPQPEVLKTLVLEALESEYGSLSGCIQWGRWTS